MRADKLTSRFQEALASAQSLALGRDHAAIEPVHVLSALLAQDGGTRANRTFYRPARTFAQMAIEIAFRPPEFS